MLNQQQKAEKRLKSKEKVLYRTLTEDAFNDFYRSRARIYRINFFRGLFFGFGSFLGATLVVAIVVALLNLFTNIPAGIGDFFRLIIDAIQQR
jgi:hypothetical protein